MIKQQAKQTGRIAEQLAITYLTQQGLKPVSKNFHSRFGEIDLIMLDKNSLAFIEVRYRKDEKHMAVIETVDQHKCKKIVMASEYFLQTHRKYQRYQCRYDVVTILGLFDSPSIEWIKNAFQA